MTRWHERIGTDKAGQLAQAVQAEDDCTVMLTSECAERARGTRAKEQVHIHFLHHLQTTFSSARTRFLCSLLCCQALELTA